MIISCDYIYNEVTVFVQCDGVYGDRLLDLACIELWFSQYCPFEYAYLDWRNCYAI